MRNRLLLLVIFLFFPPPSNGADLTKYEHFVIVGTNDLHGYLRPREMQLSKKAKLVRGGIEWFAGYIHILEKKYGNHLILLDAGDLFQGTLESNTFFGAPVVKAYNQLPYRAAAVGNHEFDYGAEKKRDKDPRGALKARMHEARFPFLAANIYLKGTDTLWKEKNLYPSTMFQAGDLKIGVIGLTTRTTVAKTAPIHISDLDFGDLTEAAKREAEALHRGGADLILIATHEGGEKPGEPINELLRTLPAGTVDAVVSGHTHSEIHQLVHGVPVIQSRTQGLYFGRIDLYMNKATHKVDPKLTAIHNMQAICGNWLAHKESCDPKDAHGKRLTPLRPARYEGEIVHPDEAIRESLAPYFAKVDAIKKEVLGAVSRDFQKLPDGESEVGSLFGEALRAKFHRAKTVYLNGGGFRRYFTKGALTYGDLYEVHPFDNKIVEVQMTGKQFKELLKVGVSGSQTLPYVYGIRAVYHKGVKSSFERDVNDDGKKEPWERDRLVSAHWEKGKEIDDDEEFWVATNDYLVSGGDNCDVVFKDIPASKRHYLDQNMRDAAADFLRRHKNTKLPLGEPEHFKAVP